MSKNLTRKSLALGAAFTLVATAVVSTPAYAAEGVVFTANTGTILAAPVTEALTLNASLIPSLPAGNIAQLKYKVVTDGTFVLKAVATSAGGSTNTFSNDDGRTYVGPFSDNNGGSATPQTTDDTGYRAAGVNTTTVITPSAPTAGVANTLALSVDATADESVATTGVAPIKTTATKTATVTAWIDSNLDGVVDSAEAQQVVTASFIKYSELASTTTIVAPVEGDTTVEARVVFTNVNNEQLTSAEVAVHFTKGDGTALNATAANVLKTATWNATNGYFKYVTGTVAALVKAEAIKVQPLVKDGGVSVSALTDVAEKFGTSATALIATRAVGEILADTVDSATTSTVVAAAPATGSALLNSSYAVRAIVKDTTAVTKLVLANQAVTVAVTSARTLSSTVTVTLNGTTYTSNAALPGTGTVAQLATTTDATGSAIVNVTTVGLTAGDDLVFVFTAENLSAQITMDNAAATFTGYMNGAVNGVTTTDGAAAAVDVMVRDQFGGTPANSKYVVTATWDTPFTAQATTASTSATSTFAAVVNGSASLSIVDNGTGVGAHKYDLDIQTLDANGAYSSPAPVLADLRVNIVDSLDASVGSVLVTDGLTSDITQDATSKLYTDTLSGTNADLVLSDMFAHDARASLTAAPDISGALGATITGTLNTVTSATRATAAVAGASVTLTSANLLFGFEAATNKWVYAVGSITVPADVSGNFTVKAWSNTAGKQTVTLTSGSGSASLLLSAFDAADDNTGTSLVISAPDYVTPGSTLSVTATLTDKYGNAVTTTGTNASNTVADFKVVYTGPGLQVGETPTKTDDSGQAKLGYFLGQNDSGTITVVVSYDANGDLDYTDTGDLVSTKTITIGVAPLAVADTKVNVGSFKGYVALYAKGYAGQKMSAIVAGKWIVVASLASDFERVVRFTGAGYTITTKIYIDGEQIGDAFTTVTK
jgi:hypothetical protein